MLTEYQKNTLLINALNKINAKLINRDNSTLSICNITNVCNNESNTLWCIDIYKNGKLDFYLFVTTKGEIGVGSPYDYDRENIRNIENLLYLN